MSVRAAAFGGENAEDRDNNRVVKNFGHGSLRFRLPLEKTRCGDDAINLTALAFRQ